MQVGADEEDLPNANNATMHILQLQMSERPKHIKPGQLLL